MPILNCEISETLMRAIQERQARTHETVPHIVMSCLAEGLEVDHATLFQVSTAGALVEGVFDGVVTIGELKEHGDFGLGTFDGLDGEMLAFDGRFYHVHSSGAVSKAGDGETVPFAVVTRFRPEHERTFADITDLDDLTRRLDGIRRTDNLFCAARIKGRFGRVRTRAAARAAAGESLVGATEHQATFDFADGSGTMVGFWTPPYARMLNVPGWHLHFLIADRTAGGHVLACAAAEVHVGIQELADLKIAMPETAAFLQADLRQDPGQDLDTAEHVR